MADPTAYKFSRKEVTEALVKKQDLHDGFWQLSFEFTIAAGQFPFQQGQVREVMPGAMLGLASIGLTRADKENDQTVDAGKVNPMKAE